MSSDDLTTSSDEYSTEELDDFTGTTLNDIYYCLKRIGKGNYASVWLSYNVKENYYYAIKIVYEEDYESGEKEVKLFKLKNIRHPNVMSYKEHFEHDGRLCIVYELLGNSLYHYCTKYFQKGIPMNDVRYIAMSILKGVDYLHSQLKIIHSDLKPENILFSKPSGEIFDIIYKKMKADTVNEVNHEKFDLRYFKYELSNCLKNGDNEKDAYYTFGKHIVNLFDLNMKKLDVSLIDFGNVSEMKNVEKDNIPTRYYTPPEILLKFCHNEKIDIWSVGCIIYELLTGEILFDPQKTKSINTDTMHLLMIKGVIGDSTFKNSKVKIPKSNIKFDDLKTLMMKNRIYDDNLYDLLLNMLNVNRKKRYSAKQCLGHKWFQQ